MSRVGGPFWHRWLPRAWLVGTAAGLALHAVVELQPAFKRKTVTLRFVAGHTAKVVFSAAQTEPEVVYAIKTEWQPLLEQPGPGQPLFIENPYHQYLQNRFTRIAASWGLAWLLVGGAGFVGLTRWLCQRGNKGRDG